MKDRREFLKGAARGAVLLGSSAAADKLGWASMLSQSGGAGKSRVVVARDEHVRGANSQWDESRVLALLDRAVATYFGRTKPMEAWKSIGLPHAAKNGVIGIKVNGLGGRGISTHAVVIQAICERLQQAGVAPGNIVVWDRTARDLQACGMKINTDRGKVRCFGSDVAGFEAKPSAWGIANVRLSKIFTQECAAIINVPVLKDHELAGVTFAMKNMYGAIDRPDTLHAGHCNPGVADLNCIPAIKEKICITIGDALASVYQGGPGFRPEYLWYPNAIVVGEDRVAVDRVACQMIEKKRAEMGLPTLAAAGRPATYIDTAADAKHKLGVSDLKRIKLIEV
jgi:uncharacterized protein (DUF362 family)